MREKEKFASQFREIQPKFSRFYVRRLTEVDMSLPQFALLGQMAAHGVISMTEASAKLDITKPAVTHLVDRLEKNGFLRRRAHPNDRRIFLLELQPKGKRLVQKVQGGALRLLLGTLKEFNAREKETIAQFYSGLSRKLDETLGRG